MDARYMWGRQPKLIHCDGVSGKQRDARARLKAGTSGNAYLKFRDEEYSRGNFNVKAITDQYNRQKERRRIEARDAQDRADDLAFARQEYEAEMAERSAPTRAMIKRAGRIPRKPRGDGYYEIHPVYGTVQHGAGLKESAASVLKHLLYKYGLPAVQHMRCIVCIVLQACYKQPSQV